jgi:hypothetical protein
MMFLKTTEGGQKIMEYLIILLLLLLVAILYFKKPNQLQDKLIDLTLEQIKQNEAEIVKGSYNALPDSLKQKIDSKVFADIVSKALDVTLDVIEDEIKK